MTPQKRLTAAVALVAALTVPVTFAVATHRDGEVVATASETSTTFVPLTTAAPTTAPPTTEAPTTTEAPPPTEPPTTAAPVTLPPTTAAPVTTVAPTTAPAPAPEPARVLPAPPPPMAVEQLDVATAFDRAKSLKEAEEQRKIMLNPPPAPVGPAPEPPVGEPGEPVVLDDPLQELSIWDQQFLQCVRWRESRNDYTVVNPYSGAGGAYQMLQSTWNNTVAHYGLWNLFGVPPQYASPHDQDLVAVRLLQWYGRSPWAGPGC